MLIFLWAVKFFTLDDSQMFVLSRAADHGAGEFLNFSGAAPQSSTGSSGLPPQLSHSPSLSSYLSNLNLSSNTLSALAHTFAENAKVTSRSRGNSVVKAPSRSASKREFREQDSNDEDGADLYMPVPPSMEITMPLMPPNVKRAASDTA